MGALDCAEAATMSGVVPTTPNPVDGPGTIATFSVRNVYEQPLPKLHNTNQYQAFFVC